MGRKGNKMTLTLWNCIGIGVGAVVAIVVTIAMCISEGVETKAKVIALIVELIVFILIAFGCSIYNTHTESGKRSVTSWDSEVNGGIERTVTVYDMQGEEIAKYHGKFDIQENAQDGIVKVKFDCDGKRHIIYAQTGTVLIDED